MIRKLIFCWICLIGVFYATKAQTTNHWKGKKAAVVLTYDDALNVHLDKVIPQLDSADLKGTFFLTVSSKAFTDRLDEWKLAAIKGHELGNHTMYHPCIGGTADRSWVKPEYDLNNYTRKRIDDEVRMTNVLLNTVDGKTTRTFAYPCGDTRVGPLSYIETIEDDFLAARGTKEEINKFDHIDLFEVSCFSIAGQDSQYMINLVRQAIREGGLVVFLFHGVGGEHGLNVDEKEHQRLVDFLQAHEKELWITTFAEVMQFVKANSR